MSMNTYMLTLIHTYIHTGKQRNEYISHFVMDANDLDRFAESAFSSHTSIEVSNEKCYIHYKCINLL